MDLEPGTMDSVRSGPYGQVFRPDNFIFGQVSSCVVQCAPAKTAAIPFSKIWRLKLRAAIGSASDVQIMCRLEQETTGQKVTTQRELS